MMIIKLPKTQYSEIVVRKSLYWIDPNELWTLTAEEEEWAISVKAPSQDFEALLHHHLNDFLLRERLDAKTQTLRHAMISASLQAVMLNVSKS
jgi:His-Xaa-Ser system protein HxsD